MKKYVAIVIMICLIAPFLMGSGGGGKSVGEQSKEEAQADEQVTGEFPSQTDGYIIFVKDANTDVRDMVKAKIDFDEIYIQKASPAIASNCGPGTFGLLFFTE